MSTATATTPTATTVRDVVTGRLPGPFTALRDGRVVSAEAEAWAQPGKLPADDHWVHLTALCPGTGLAGVALSPGSTVRLFSGAAVPAAAVRPGDLVTTWFTRRIPPDVAAVLIGTLLAGGSLVHRNLNAGTAALELAATQVDRAHALRCLGMAAQPGGGHRPRTVLRSAWSVELGHWRRRFYADDRRRRTVPPGLRPSPAALAVWWADAGQVDADGWGRLAMGYLRGDVQGQLHARAALVDALPVAADDVLWDARGAALLLRPSALAALRAVVDSAPAPRLPDRLPPGVPVPAPTPVYTAGRGSARLQRAPRLYAVTLAGGARPFVGTGAGVAW